MIEKFNVLFLDNDGLPICANMFAQNPSVCIGQNIATSFCNAVCDRNSTAHFSVKNFPEGTYYLRGVWKEGYVNFTKPLTLKVQNNKIILDKDIFGKEIEITENYTIVIKTDY